MVHVTSVKPLADYRLEVVFDDGAKGVFDVEPARRGGVFLKLLDSQVFNAVAINPDFGCVEWPGGVDLAPEAMHEVITGRPAKSERYSAEALREEKRSPGGSDGH